MRQHAWRVRVAFSSSQHALACSCGVAQWLGDQRAHAGNDKASDIFYQLRSVGHAARAATNADVTVPRGRRGDYAEDSLDNIRIAFVLVCHVWSHDKLRVTARNVSLPTLDLLVAALHVRVMKQRVG